MNNCSICWVVSERLPPGCSKHLQDLDRARTGLFFRWTPHPVIVTIRQNGDHIRVLLYLILSYHCYRVGGPPSLFCSFLHGRSKV